MEHRSLLSKSYQQDAKQWHKLLHKTQHESDKGLSHTMGIAWSHHLFLYTTEYLNVDLEFIIFLHHKI